MRASRAQKNKRRFLQRKHSRWAAIARSARAAKTRRLCGFKRDDLRLLDWTRQRRDTDEQRRRRVRAPITKETLDGVLGRARLLDLRRLVRGRSSTRLADQCAQRNVAALGRMQMQRRRPHAENQIRQHPQQNPQLRALQILARKPACEVRHDFLGKVCDKWTLRSNLTQSARLLRRGNRLLFSIFPLRQRRNRVLDLFQRLARQRLQWLI